MTKILTDCASDMTPEEAQRLGVTLAPLYIQFSEGEVNALDLTPDQFYARLLAAGHDIPSTAQPAAGEFAELFRELGQDGEPILAIHLSEGLSGTIQSSRLGAQQVEDGDITVWDSKTLAGGERFQVLAAAWANERGWSLDAILERLELIRDQNEVIYTLETLDYLARGGRIGRVQALAGLLLKIKPVINVDHADGKYSTVGKGRSLRKAQQLIVDHLRELYGAKTPLWVSVQHGQWAEEAESLTKQFRDALNVVFVETVRVSPILGVHTGPGIVGASIVPMELLADLRD